MKATAKVTIQVGLLSINDVSIYSAIESGEKVSFNQLHAECKCKLQQKMYCPSCNKDIVDKKAEIVKGYPMTKDSWVVLSEAEIDACKKESTNKLNVIQFVEPGDIPEIYYESPAYLGPGKNDKETFSLFYQLLKECNKVALAKIVMRQKDHFFALRAYDGVIVAYDLYFPAAIRDTAEIEKPEATGIDAETFELAKTLVESMTRPFDKNAIKDEYSDALRKIIQDKSEGKVIDITEKKVQAKVISLKDALKGTLEALSKDGRMKRSVDMDEAVNQ